MSPPRKIKVRFSDGVVLKLHEHVATRSGLIRQAIEDGYGDDVIPLRDVSSISAYAIFNLVEYEDKYLRKKIANDIALHYLEKTKIEYTSALDSRILEAEIKSRDALDELNYRKAQFVNVDNNTLFDLIRAVDYLDIPELLDLTCQNLLDRIGRNIRINEIPWDIDQLLLRNDQWAELNELI